MRPAPDRLLLGRVRLIGGFRHQGPARDLVHQLKYRGVVWYAGLVAETLAPRLPVMPLVPVPRAWARRARYGLDPAVEIALRIGRATGAPVLSLLAPPIFRARRAGGDHTTPVAPFLIRGDPAGPVILIDDVVTTGATMASAALSLGPDLVAMAAAANLADGVSSLFGFGGTLAAGGDIGQRPDRR